MSNKKLNLTFKTVGTLFIDLGKLTFASLILGVLLKGTVDQFLLIIFGIAAVVILFIVGILLVSVSEE